MPLVWELTSEIKNWLTPEKLRDFSASWRAQGTGISEIVIEDFISIMARPDMHYESLLGYLETQYIRSTGALSQDYYGFYSWLIEIVYYILYYRHTKNRDFLEAQLPRFDGIRALADASRPLWIFSLNHDVIIETIAARLSIPLHTGFSANIVRLPRRNSVGQKIGEIRAETLTHDQIENKAMFYPNPPKPGIYLMKIHGALDIFTFNDGKDLLKLLPEEMDTFGYVEALRAANEDLLYPLPGAPNGRVKATNEIAYADEAGEMQFLRKSLLSGAYKFNPRGQQVLPKSMLRHFRANLNFVTNLICIGYGLGDLHVNAIIREWLELTPDRRLEIVNPSLNDIPSFLLHLAPQVKLTKSDTTDFLDLMSGTVRSRREQLQKRVAVALRQRGKTRAAQDMNDFAKKEKDRYAALLTSKLSGLGLMNGHLDLTALGDPSEIAKQWASEVKMDDEAFWAALLDHLEEAKNC